MSLHRHTSHTRPARRPRRRTMAARVAAAAGLLLVAGPVMAGCSSTPPAGDPSAQTASLDVVSWWTSPSERAALNVLYDAFRAADHDVDIIDGAVEGGSGSNAQVVLAERLRQGNPPDVWQTFLGGALSSLVASNRVADLSAVYAESGLAEQLPKTLVDALNVDGKPYGVPTSAHRQNVLWFNPAVLAKAGVVLPGRGYTTATFRADLQTLQQTGAVPLCLGGKDRFTKVELFENVLLSEIGADADRWSAIAADRFDWSGPTVRAALRTFGALLDHADPDADALTWDQAVRKFRDGQCAFLSMNDSAYGEVTREAREPAGTPERVQSVPFPGTGTSYLAVVDTFVLAKGAVNMRNGLRFLEVIANPTTQAAFSKDKGSVPVRGDADLSGLTPYQQTAAAALRTGPLLLSVTHGEAVSPRVQHGVYDAVAAYAASRDTAAFTRALVNAVSGGRPPGY